MWEGKRKQAELGNGNRKRWAVNFSQWISWPVPQRPQTGLALHICPGLVAFPFVSPYIVEREHDPRWGSFLYPQDYGRDLEGGGLLAASLLLGKKILQSKKDLGWVGSNHRIHEATKTNFTWLIYRILAVSFVPYIHHARKRLEDTSLGKISQLERRY